MFICAGNFLDQSNFAIKVIEIAYVAIAILYLSSRFIFLYNLKPVGKVSNRAFHWHSRVVTVS